MYQQRLGARAEYRQAQGQRVRDSATLSDRFKRLKTLTVELEYFDSESATKNGQIKYTVNLANAKSVFRFSCPNNECVRGDFDLTNELARAVAARRTSATGEVSCPGWRSKAAINTARCRNKLRYKLTLTYH